VGDYTECALKLQKLAGTDIKIELIEDMLLEVDDTIGFGSTMQDKAEAIATIAKKRAFEKKMLLRVKAKDLIREQENIAKIRGFKNPIQGLISLLTGHSTVQKGSMNSVDAKQKFQFIKVMNSITQQLEELDLLQLFNSRTLSREVSKELWHMGAENAPKNPSGNRNAEKIAEVLFSARRYLTDRANHAGAWIEDRLDYVANQTHDPSKLKKVSFEDWKAYIEPKLGKETFKGIHNKKDFLKNIYDALQTGLHFNHSKRASLKTGDNIAKSMSKDRVLHFKDADSWYDYMQKFGAEDFNSVVVRGFKSLSDNTVLMDSLGSSPSIALFRLKENVLKKLRASRDAVGVTPKQRHRIEKDIEFVASTKLDKMLSTVSGAIDAPETNNILSTALRGMRDLRTMALLGKMVLSSVSDMGLNGSEARYRGVGFLKAYSSPILNLFRGRGNAEQRKAARMLQVYSEGMLGQLYNRHFIQDGIPGFFSNSIKTFFKYSLNNWWTDAHRTGFALAFGADVFDNIQIGWDKMPSEMKRIFTLHNLGEKEISLFAGLGEDLNGVRVFASESILDIPDAKIKAYLGGSATKNQISKARNDLEQRVGVMYVSRTDHAHLTPGAAERYQMLSGTQAGTLPGEVMRSLMQFKSFSVSFMNKIWSRETMGRMDVATDQYGMRGLADGLKHGSGSVRGLFEVAAMTTMFGYVAIAAKDLASGKEPPDPERPDTWKRAFIQGGASSLFGDYMLGQYSRYGNSALGSMAGPIFGEVDGVFELWTALKNGDEKTAFKAWQTVQGFIPYQNLFYTEAAMDYMFFHQIQEMLNPGYLMRSEASLKDRTGQEHFVPPSSNIPYGGGTNLFEGLN
jgi:hypothetical protein